MKIYVVVVLKHPEIQRQAKAPARKYKTSRQLLYFSLLTRTLLIIRDNCKCGIIYGLREGETANCYYSFLPQALE